MNFSDIDLPDINISESSQDNAASQSFSGNILLLYVFDVGDEIDLHHVERKQLVTTNTVQRSAFFKDYHVPLSFSMKKSGPKKKDMGDILFSKLYNFGVISVCYKIPFTRSLEGLKRIISIIKKQYNKQGVADCEQVFDAIGPAIKKPRFFNLQSSYVAIHVNHSMLRERIAPEDLMKEYSEQIASLVRFETRNLSEHQMREILSSTTGYYGRDMTIIDNEATFIYDDEFGEILEFLESAILQKLELRYFDRLLDRRINYFYTQESFSIPWRAYIPIIGRRFELPISHLAKLQVDISVVTERLESSIILSGDAYYTKVYSMLVNKLMLQQWQNSLNRKLEIIKYLYTVYQDRLDIIHEEILTIVIIILIALEAFIAFFK